MSYFKTYTPFPFEKKVLRKLPDNTGAYTSGQIWFHQFRECASARCQPHFPVPTSTSHTPHGQSTQTWPRSSIINWCSRPTRTVLRPTAGKNIVPPPPWSGGVERVGGTRNRRTTCVMQTRLTLFSSGHISPELVAIRGIFIFRLSNFS